MPYLYDKQILTKDSFIPYILEGINLLDDIVNRTLGPGGLPILIERMGQNSVGDPLPPMITKDGVTVANACYHKDPRVDIVIQTVKAICQKTNQEVGDGTTSGIVLGRAILNLAFEELNKDSKLNPQLVRDSIERAAKRIIAALKEYSTPISDLKSVRDVAMISANGDEAVGNTIHKAFEFVGAEGVITVDEGYSANTTVDLVEGFQIRRGAEAGDRFFNSPDKSRFEAENVRVLLYDGTLNSFSQVMPFFAVLSKQAIASKQKVAPPVLIVANDFGPEVIQFFLIQKQEAHVQICAVKSPHVNLVRTSMLDDMAILLNGSRLGNGGKNVESIELKDIGVAGKVVVDKYSTTFYDGAGSEQAVLDRVDQLKVLRANAESPYDAALVSDRIAALSGGVAKIGVGGLTDLEIKERYHRIEDALNAARAAIAEGVVPGGGITPIRLVNALNFRDSLEVGERILYKAAHFPILRLLNNIGINVSLQDVLFVSSDSKPLFDFLSSLEFEEKVEHTDTKYTIDARTKKLVNALEAGIVDPTKVLRIALENAVSVAALLSSCGGAIINTREERANQEEVVASNNPEGMGGLEDAF